MGKHSLKEVAWSVRLAVKNDPMVALCCEAAVNTVVNGLLLTLGLVILVFEHLPPRDKG